jgi:hypothetical protein
MAMNLTTRIGFPPQPESARRSLLRRIIHLKLATLGCEMPHGDAPELREVLDELLQRNREVERLLAGHLSPADQRIQDFLDDYLRDAGGAARLPARTFVLNRHGVARELSLPHDRDEFVSDIVHSYRIKQGVLHNPASDRRTTAGVFHVAEGGLPIPDDKLAVPKAVFAQMLRHALKPPAVLAQLPYTSTLPRPAECFVTLLLRPVVCPEVPGFTPHKSMETRFFVPGNLVSNLDFVESIFGNAGDPFLPENDAALDPEQWSGHTGCVILAPHLVKLTKKELGLPAWDAATERQRRDGMCWKQADELYNGGSAFKLTARDRRGVIVTIIADNYFGYCKKEVKTQLGYAANLFGLVEEEHAGGALVFPSYDLGEEFSGDKHVPRLNHNFAEMASLFGGVMDVKPEGYAVDRKFPDIIYVPENVHFDLHKQAVSWEWQGQKRSIKLLPNRTYVRPSGYKVHMEKPPGGRAWRLIGTVAEGTLCHKPCTVSGGGKSEISKPITDAIIGGPVFVANLSRELEMVQKIVRADYSQRFRDPALRNRDSRPLLSPERSLGSVIKLLTPSSDYSDDFNASLRLIPQYIKELVFVLKRFYKPAWGDAWQEHFSVDIINGTPGFELKCDNRVLVSNYLRVGFERDGAWRTFGLRKDFQPAVKLQTEDDITASIVVPAAALAGLNPSYPNASVKFVQNCEYRLFQRPDDAIHRGYDKVTEHDLIQPGNFLSNFEPLTPRDARELLEDAIGFVKFTEPVQDFIREVAETGQPAFFVSSAHPRLVDGKPSKNPRYLQTRPDLLKPREWHLAEMAMRLFRRVPVGKPLLTPVNAVLPGRRNNPPEGAKIRALAAYGPVHYMELPELFMEFVCSMTGKSPSTTGAGSEGALTKGPFNALPPVFDLNAALVSYILTGYDAFITAAGCVGPHFRVDHDISLLVPEVWSRMSVEERSPRYLIENGLLERCEDFTQEGAKIPFSRLGWRITLKFVDMFFGRVFNHPHVVFTEAMLRPEKQDWDIFVDGMENIISTQRRVAQAYFNDGSVAQACPPLRALLHIMRDDQFEGKDLGHPEIRALFSRDNVLASDWYRARLEAKQQHDIALWRRHVEYLNQFLARPNYGDEAARLGIPARLSATRQTLEEVQSAAYRERLRGTIGLQLIP